MRGTGAVGIEALSRGAAHVTFVEQDAARGEADRSEPAPLGAGRASGAIIRAGFADAGTRLAGRVFDFVILDPPYA